MLLLFVKTHYKLDNTGIIFEAVVIEKAPSVIFHWPEQHVGRFVVFVYPIPNCTSGITLIILLNRRLRVGNPLRLYKRIPLICWVLVPTNRLSPLGYQFYACTNVLSLRTGLQEPKRSDIWSKHKHFYREDAFEDIKLFCSRGNLLNHLMHMTSDAMWWQ